MKLKNNVMRKLMNNKKIQKIKLKNFKKFVKK